MFNICIFRIVIVIVISSHVQYLHIPHSYCDFLQILCKRYKCSVSVAAGLQSVDLIRTYVLVHVLNVLVFVLLTHYSSF